jgi:hypothetical protein
MAFCALRIETQSARAKSADGAIDESGNLYGPDYSYESEAQGYINAIRKMTPSGGFTYSLAPTNSLPRGMSIWRDRDGNMYSVEQNNHLKRETLPFHLSTCGTW